MEISSSVTLLLISLRLGIKVCQRLEVLLSVNDIVNRFPTSFFSDRFSILNSILTDPFFFNIDSQLFFPPCIRISTLPDYLLCRFSRLCPTVEAMCSAGKNIFRSAGTAMFRAEIASRVPETAQPGLNKTFACQFFEVGQCRLLLLFLSECFPF